MSIQLTGNYQFTEKKFGDLIYNYILASREDLINYNDKDPFENQNMERYDNIQRDSYYKVECRKYVNIKSDVKYIMSFMFGKFIEEIKSICDNDIKIISNIELTDLQKDIIKNISSDSRNILSKKFIKYNKWEAINDCFDYNYVVTFMYEIVKNTSNKILDTSTLGISNDPKQYFKQKIEQSLNESFKCLNDSKRVEIIELIGELFDMYLKCLCDIINRILIYNYSTLKKDNY